MNIRLWDSGKESRERGAAYLEKGGRGKKEGQSRGRGKREGKGIFLKV